MEQGAQRPHLIVNADDFGLTRGINRGIIEAHERGIVTSASLMVRYPDAEEAAAYGRRHSTFSIGLHFDAAEWRFDGKAWKAAYEVIDTRDAEQVRTEFAKQLRRFKELMGRNPTHIDSHQHVHSSDPTRSILLGFADQIGVPLRNCYPKVNFQGGFYGQTGEGEPFADGISLTGLRRLIESTQPGWTELGCHPGYSDDLDSVYALEREEELRTLCDPRIMRAIADDGVRLCSFSDFAQTRA